MTRVAWIGFSAVDRRVGGYGDGISGVWSAWSAVHRAVDIHRDPDGRVVGGRTMCGRRIPSAGEDAWDVSVGAACPASIGWRERPLRVCKRCAP